MLDEEILDEQFAPGLNSRSDIRKMMAFKKDMRALVMKTARTLLRAKEREKNQSLRYLRRAANQLVKGLRSISAG